MCFWRLGKESFQKLSKARIISIFTYSFDNRNTHVSGVTTYVMAWILLTRSMKSSLIYKVSLSLRKFIKISVCQN